MTNLVLVKAVFVKSGNAELKYQKLSRPQMSRPVDFSVNVKGPSSDDKGKPLFDSGSVAFGESTTELGHAGIQYDSNLGYWVTKDSEIMGDIGESGNNKSWNKDIVGDFYWLMEDIGSIPPLVYWQDNDNFGSVVDAVNGSRLATARYSCGLSRMFMPFGVYNGADPNPDNGVYVNVYGCNAGAKQKMIYGGFTWPVNTVLHNAGYQDVVTDNGTGITTGVRDPQEALKIATKDVCTKLKEDWVSNIRIYVVKFRKQTKYKNRINNAEANFDYSYLNDCASGTSAPYMYDVNDDENSEEALKAALSKIAEDIKSNAFASYKEAKNVE
jgi:hypothetical protein